VIVDRSSSTSSKRAWGDLAIVSHGHYRPFTWQPYTMSAW
jgi:hypothetical protein